MTDGVATTIEADGHTFLDVHVDGGPLERLFARLAVSVGAADCWFDVDTQRKGVAPVRIACTTPENRRFVARWLHAMRAAEVWEQGRNRPVLAVPKPKPDGKGKTR